MPALARFLPFVPVTQGISDQLLQWKGIEAMEKLATSPNTKVIVVGGGKTGLPLILGQ